MMDRYQQLTIALFEGRITPEEEHELSAFLDSDASASSKMHTWDNAWQLRQPVSDHVDALWQDFLQQIPTTQQVVPMWRRPVVRWVAAACLLVLMMVPSLLWLSHPGSLSHHLTATATLPQATVVQSVNDIVFVTLPDSSRVVLNMGSTLSYAPDFGNKDRQVQLTGEAYFEVEKDTQHPFVVSADGLKIRVTGTRFNVAAYEESTQTTVSLLEGSVQVTNPVFEADLVPDEKLVYTRASKELVKRLCDAQASIAWLDGNMDYERVRLEELLSRLARMYREPIYIEDEAVRSMDVHYYMDERYPLHEVMDALQEVYKLSIRHDEDGYHVQL